MVKEDQFKSGFVVNELKYFWEPRQKGEHLGFIVDLRSTGSIAGGSFQIHFPPKPLKI